MMRILTSNSPMIRKIGAWKLVASCYVMRSWRCWNGTGWLRPRPKRGSWETQHVLETQQNTQPVTLRLKCQYSLLFLDFPQLRCFQVSWYLYFSCQNVGIYCHSQVGSGILAFQICASHRLLPLLSLVAAELDETSFLQKASEIVAGLIRSSCLALKQVEMDVGTSECLHMFIPYHIKRTYII